MTLKSIKILAAALMFAAAFSGCSGQQETETSPQSEETEIMAAEPVSPDILTVGEVQFSIYDDTADVQAVLGDKISMDVTEPGSDWLCGCLDIGMAVFYSPNYNGDPSAFKMYNGLTGASGAEEIEAVLGEDCIKVTDDEGVHFLEVFANLEEIDYSQYSTEGDFDQVFMDILESVEPVSDSILLFCYNCCPDGSSDHIVDLYRD